MIDPYKLEKFDIEFDYNVNIKNFNYDEEGLYFIFNKNNVLIYIGQSIHIKRRLETHKELWYRKFSAKISFIKYSENLYKEELKYIKKYPTRFNKESPIYDNFFTEFNYMVRLFKRSKKSDMKKGKITKEEYNKLYPYDEKDKQLIKEFVEGWI